jgi:hypothetical protein
MVGLGVSWLADEIRKIFCQVLIAPAFQHDLSVADQKAGHFGE